MKTKIDGVVRGWNNNVPHSRNRYRYRTLIGGLFDPDTDPDPDADKAKMVFFTNASRFLQRGSHLP
jgi:hypothetical protein